jgi:hypothetical protein
MAVYNKPKPQKSRLKKVKTDESITNSISFNKKPVAKFNPAEYESMRPGWSFKRIVNENKWGLIPEEFIKKESEGMSTKCILSLLTSHETMTWREIKQKTHDDGDSSNHYIDEKIHKLCKEARNRLYKLRIHGNIFSLSLGNTKRIYGVLDSNILEILWYDNKHEIYPINYGNKK